MNENKKIKKTPKILPTKRDFSFPSFLKILSSPTSASFQNLCFKFQQFVTARMKL